MLWLYACVIIKMSTAPAARVIAMDGTLLRTRSIRGPPEWDDGTGYEIVRDEHALKYNFIAFNNRHDQRPTLARSADAIAINFTDVLAMRVYGSSNYAMMIFAKVFFFSSNTLYGNRVDRRVLRSNVILTIGGRKME